MQNKTRMDRIFESVVVVALQITFRAEIYQNNVFYIFKKSFLKLARQNDPKHKKINFLQNKFNFFKNVVQINTKSKINLKLNNKIKKYIKKILRSMNLVGLTFIGLNKSASLGT
jgi:hypothetical protein